jgi:hypothetical protein
MKNQTVVSAVSTIVSRRNFGGWDACRFSDDKGLEYCAPQKCWTNYVWGITPKNENNPVMINFYSIDGARVTDEECYQLVSALKAEEILAVANQRGCPTIDVCWEDFIPACSLVWKNSCVLAVQNYGG